jgi:hypothetical protein
MVDFRYVPLLKQSNNQPSEISEVAAGQQISNARDNWRDAYTNLA